MTTETKMSADEVLATIARHRDTHESLGVVDAYSAQEYPRLRDAHAAVAALIARNAELEADNKAHDWQTLDRPLLKVFFMKGDDPFVFAAHGRIAGIIEEVEKDLRENPPSWFEEYGDGDYTFRANYFEGEYGDYGRCVFPAGWELDLLAFEPLKDAARAEAGHG